MSRRRKTRTRNPRTIREIHLGNGVWILGSLVSGAILIGLAIQPVLERLDDQTLYMLIGGGTLLGVVLVVSIVLMAKDLVQAYIMRRLMADDRIEDLQQLAMVAKLMGRTRGGSPPINIEVPNPGEPSRTSQPPALPPITSWDSNEGDSIEFE